MKRFKTRSLCLLLLIASPLSAATRVPIEINEVASRTVAWPITTGVPFPRGALNGEDQCRLVDDRGTEQPLQSQAAATWDARRASIRWLTIDFIAEPDRTYALEFGPDIRRQRFDSGVKIEDRRERDEGDGLILSTGKISVQFLRDGPSSIGEIRTGSEVVLKGSADGEHYFLDQDGRRHSSVSDGGDRTSVIEETGPVRACVRVDGFYTGPDGERIARYRTRYHLFAGLGLIKVVDEFKIVASTRDIRFADLGFALDFAGETSGRRVRAGETEHDWTTQTAAVRSFQETYRHVGNPDCVGGVVESRHDRPERVLQATERAAAWLQVTDRRRSVTGSLRWFWQQFPKEWEANEDSLVLHFWSPRAGELDFGARGLRDFFGEAGHKYVLAWQGVRGTMSPISNFFYFAGHAALERGDVDGLGINKHHEFYLHVGSDAEAATGAEHGKLAADPPIALASGKWNCLTSVFGPLMPRPNDLPHERIVDRIFDLGRQAQDDFGDYGWWFFGSGPHYSYQWDEQTGRHYADPRRFEYHTYQKEMQLWWCYLRSGERKFYDWAFPAENHWIDVATTHVPLTYRCAWKGGFRHEQTLHFRPGDWSIDSAMHYVRQRDSAEAWLRGGSQFWASYHRNLETTTLAYYLTGDRRYDDVLNYWRDYWADLAGKTSASPDVKPWHREQPWFVATGPDDRARTWAEMIRDYCPFTSGLRHQMTQFFNLATLYEHTWDPRIGQALRECAAVYLDPEHPIGVWRTQENGLPNYAEVPQLCHFWVPALWKYARATGDPRMPTIFRKYFDAVHAADPWREDRGVYSNAHIGWAYFFTRDPKHLRAAQWELDKLLVHAEPLQRPQDLGRRIYNPYAPIASLTAVPRLEWALHEAKQNRVTVPAAPLSRPQRTLLAVRKDDQPLRVQLWGFDKQPTIVGPTGGRFRRFQVETRRHVSDIQPFDRHMRDFEVWRHDVTIPADAEPGYYTLAPRLELAVLSVAGSGSGLLINAARPVSLEPGESCWFSGMQSTLEVESANLAGLAARVDGEELPVRSEEGRKSFELPKPGASVRVQITNTSRSRVWFRIANWPAEAVWGSFSRGGPSEIPSCDSTHAALARLQAVEADDSTFVPGRFGQAIRIANGRTLTIPDFVPNGSDKRKLTDPAQGTIEFWIKRQWDDRLRPVKPVTFLTNGEVQAWSPWQLPFNEWAHVAVEWRPLKRDPNRQAVHIYVDGHDRQNYRSTWWEGYSQKPKTFGKVTGWLDHFVCRSHPDAPFVIDELRISNAPRYANLNVRLGGQQIFNPSRFDPPTRPFTADDRTVMLFHFDRSTIGETALSKQKLVAEILGDGPPRRPGE